MQVKSFILSKTIIALHVVSILVSGCAREAPVWDGIWDGSTPADTGKPEDTGTDTGEDTAGDTDDTDLDVLPPGVAAAPKGTVSTIDGLLNEAAWDVSVPVNRVIEGNGNNTIRFGALWDDFFLYIGVHVDDPNLKNDSIMTWQDDSVEVFLDGDYSRSASYDDHDLQYWIEYGSNTLTVTYGKPLNAKHALALIDGGYSVELAVPWEDLKVTPSLGMKIGFDIGVNDDDNGEGRDAHHMWNGNDNNWTNTSAFGTLILK